MVAFKRNFIHHVKHLCILITMVYHKSCNIIWFWSFLQNVCLPILCLLGANSLTELPHNSMSFVTSGSHCLMTIGCSSTSSEALHMLMNPLESYAIPSTRVDKKLLMLIIPLCPSLQSTMPTASTCPLQRYSQIYLHSFNGGPHTFPHQCPLPEHICCDLISLNVLRRPCAFHCRTQTAFCSNRNLCIRRNRPTHRGCKAGIHRRRKNQPRPRPVLIGNRQTIHDRPWDRPNHPDYLPHGPEDTPHRHIQNLVPTNEKPCKSALNTHFCMISARSVRNKTAELVDFVYDHKLDIVGICETWISPDDSAVNADLVPAGYSFKHVPRTHKRGGVGMLYRDELHVNFRNNPQNFNSFESLQAEVVDNSVAIHLVILYRPPGSKHPFCTFLDEFACLVDSYLFEPSSLIITGDFNIHVDKSSSSESVQFTELLSAHGLHQHIDNPTHQRGHILDLFISRLTTNIVFSSLKVVSGISDHSAVICDLLTKKPKSLARTLSTRNLHSINLRVFGNEIEEGRLTEKCGVEDVSVAVDSYNSMLCQILDTYAPVRTRTIKIRFNTGWFNDEVYKAKNKRRQLEHKWRSSKLEIDRQIYHQQHQHVISLIRKAKTAHYSSLVSKCGGDQKQLFRVANTLLNRSKESTLP